MRRTVLGLTLIIPGQARFAGHRLAGCLAVRSPGKPLVVVNSGGRAGGARQVEDRKVRD
jgi:hypothetical protein